MTIDQVLIAIEHEHEALTYLVVTTARRHQVLAAGNLRGLAEQQRRLVWIKFVEGVAHGGVRATARGRIRFPTFR